MTANDLIRTPWGPMTMATIEEKVTDGYHTIKELYEHLDALFTRLCSVRRDSSWKTAASTVTEVSDVPDLMIGLDVGPDKHIGWYLPQSMWNRLDVQELDDLPDWSWDWKHYSKDMYQHAEWLLAAHVPCTTVLGQPMPPIKGEDVPNYGTIMTPEGPAPVPKSLLGTTFNELYALRHALFITLCNEHFDKAWRALTHEDGTMFPDYFIAGIEFAEGMVTYHLPIELWDMLHVMELGAAPPWDGHKPSDVVTRLLQGLD